MARTRWQGVALGLLVGWLGRPAPALPPVWPPASYAFYYGEWTESTVAQAWQFELVVVHPGLEFNNLTAELCRQVKCGRDGRPGTADDVLVLGYVSVGEDESVPAGPPLPGARLRGPLHQKGGKLIPQNGNYPTCFLDQVAYQLEGGIARRGPDGKPLLRDGPDGIPDENGVWGSFYVNPGDEAWRKAVAGRMVRMDRELAVDGFFLDTLDTASPWGRYRFTAAGMAGLLQEVLKAWPQKILVGNRGMFLLDTHAQAYRASLDAVLFESFLTDWNWSLSTGAGSPWLGGNRDLLRGAMAGLPTLFLDYLDPKQSDFYNFLHQAADLGALGYVADPLLQKFYPPTLTLFPKSSDVPMATLRDLLATNPGPGRLGLTFSVDNPGQLKWGQELFLDVRYGEGTPEVLPALPVDYSGQPGTFESFGLPDGPLTVHVRLLGQARNLRTPWQTATLASTGAGPGIAGLHAAGRQDAVELRWEGSASEVYVGENPFRLTKLGPVQGTRHLVTGLPVGQPRWFAVASRPGVLSRPVCASAIDCTPPPAPAGVTAQAQGQALSVAWQPVTASDLGGYRVYAVPTGQAYRIPVRQGADVVQARLGPAAPGRYRIFVTSFDSSGNESSPSNALQVTVP